MAESKHLQVSCIIPAFNESKRIEKILQTALSSNCLSEIIVVDDCSTDTTVEIVKRFSEVKLIVNSENQGKTKSVSRGIREAKGSHVLIFDADLAGVTPEHFRSMVQPVKEGIADVTISIRQNTPSWMKAIGIDFMAGERLLSRSVVLPYLTEMDNMRSYGLEVFLNEIIIRNNLRIKSVFLSCVVNTFKWEKEKFLVGIRKEKRMYGDILNTVDLFRFLRQNFKLKKLLV